MRFVIIILILSMACLGFQNVICFDILQEPVECDSKIARYLCETGDCEPIDIDITELSRALFDNMTICLMNASPWQCYNDEYGQHYYIPDTHLQGYYDVMDCIQGGTKEYCSDYQNMQIVISQRDWDYIIGKLRQAIDKTTEILKGER